MELIRANQYDYLINQIKKYVILDTPNPFFPVSLVELAQKSDVFPKWWHCIKFGELLPVSGA